MVLGTDTSIQFSFLTVCFVSLVKGHYTAYCYNDLTDTWEYYNDSTVKVVNDEEVSNAQVYPVILLC